MPYAHKTSQPTKDALRRGDLALAVNGGQNLGPTSATGYYNTISPPVNGYAIYSLGLNNNPIGMAVTTDDEIIKAANTLGGSVSSKSDALVYLAGRTSTWILHSMPNNIVTDELVLALNAGDLSSYPTKGNDFYDLSGENNNGTLTNGPTFNSNGWIDFDGVNDWCNIPNTNLVPGSVTSLTVGGLWKRNGDGSSYETILHQSSNTSIGNSAYWFGWTNDNIVCCTIGARNGVGWAAGKTNIPATVGKWFYTVASWNGSTVSVWVNGILKVTYNLSTYTNPGTVTRLGASGNASGYLANGGIANIHINPNKAFTTSEMLQNYYQGPIVTDGLVFAMDPGNLVSFENGTTTTYSLTGSIEGTNINGLGFNSSYGGVFDFDGSDDRIQLGNQPTMVTSDITQEAWVNGDAFVNWHGIISNMSGWGTGFSLQIGITQNIAAMVSGDYLKTSWTPSTGVWYHIVATHRSSDNLNVLYVNGVQENTMTRAISYNTNAVTEIGVFYTGGSLPFNGKMGPLRTYNRALTSDEVQQNYNAQSSRFK